MGSPPTVEHNSPHIRVLQHARCGMHAAASHWDKLDDIPHMCSAKTFYTHRPLPKDPGSPGPIKNYRALSPIY